METFPFPYHRVSDAYPESSVVVSYGGGYEFASEPRGPDQIVFRLSFSAMFYYERGGKLDTERNPKINMAALEQFYERHRMWKFFIYEHPRRGPLKVRFKKPLETPDGVPDGSGLLKDFTIELRLQP